jgi:hypothetical protein
LSSVATSLAARWVVIPSSRTSSAPKRRAGGGYAGQVTSRVDPAAWRRASCRRGTLLVELSRVSKRGSRMTGRR